MDTHVVIWSSLAGSIFSLLGSATAALLVWRSSSKQRLLQEKLQIDSQTFEEASAKRLEAYKQDLSRKQDIESIRIKELIEAVSKSKVSTKAALDSFRTLVKKSQSADDREFLTEFQKAIIALNGFSEGLSNLEYLVRPKDLLIFKNINKHFLEILLGMRLERERRALQDFKIKTHAYEIFLGKAERLISAKYRAVLQPRTVGAVQARPALPGN